MITHLSIDSLDKEVLIRLIKSYNNYIQINAEENPEFGHSWFPVSIHEYLNNEFLME